MTSEASRKTLKKLLLNNECEFVSLGHNCDVAHFLRYSGLRKKAYPFDWCVTPSQSILELIENDFFDFLNLNNLAYSEPHKAMQFEGEGHRTIEKDEVVTTVYCNKYKMSFPHDFCDDSVEEYDKVIEKYDLRIKRFISLLNSDKKILLVFKPEREEGSAQWIDQLSLIVRSKYTSASFYFCSVQELKIGLRGNWKIALKIQLKRKVQRTNQAVRRLLKFRS